MNKYTLISSPFDPLSTKTEQYYLVEILSARDNQSGSGTSSALVFSGIESVEKIE